MPVGRRDQTPPPDRYGPALRQPFRLRVLQARYCKIASEWNAVRVRSGFWRLYLNSDDGAEVLATDAAGAEVHHPLTRGQFHLVPAWCTFTCRNRRALDHLYLHFDWMGLPVTSVTRTYDQPIALPPCVAMDGIGMALHRRLAEGSSDQPAAAAFAQAKALVYLAIAHLLEQTEEGRDRRLLNLLDDRHPVAPALRLIEQSRHAPLSNAQLADACRLSEDYFIRRFRRHVGATPSRYVNERRIAAAAEQLAYSDDSIEHIAERFGFPDRFYFTRVFTRLMGVAPAAYRRQPIV